jgi:predicted RNA-binding protein with PIN domain
MWILVDGYNVLFALGMIPPVVKRGDLQQARQALLNLLADGLGDQAKRCTVVFDATRSPSRTPGDTTFRGIEVRFTKRRQEADDLITWLIKQCPAPKQLTVVSSDHQLVDSARRRKATPVRADGFLEWLERQKQPPAAATPAAPALDPAERDKWLAEFGHLDQEFRDTRTFPEHDWQRTFRVAEDDDLRDVRKRHRMKPDE